MTLTDAQLHALRVLRSGRATATNLASSHLPARRVNSRTANALRRAGLAERSDLDGRWQITPTGRDYIDRTPTDPEQRPGGARSWTLHLPDLPYVTSNTREHWAERASCNAAWRKATGQIAGQQLRIPTCERIRVELVYWPPTAHRRDPDNLVTGVLKPIVDGLVDAGVVPDDTAAYVDRNFPEIRAPRPDRKPTWHLTVTDLGDPA